MLNLPILLKTYQSSAENNICPYWISIYIKLQWICKWIPVSIKKKLQDPGMDHLTIAVLLLNWFNSQELSNVHLSSLPGSLHPNSEILWWKFNNYFFFLLNLYSIPDWVGFAISFLYFARTKINEDSVFFIINSVGDFFRSVICPTKKYW